MKESQRSNGPDHVVGVRRGDIVHRANEGFLVAGLAWQVGWLAAGAIILRFAWRASLKNYSAVGG